MPYIERVKTHVLLNGAGPDAQSFDLKLPDGLDAAGAGFTYEIEAWIGNFGSSNVYICRGGLTLVQCQDLLVRGLTDVLMCVTGWGPSRVRLPDDCPTITVFFEAVNASGQAQAVTVKVCGGRAGNK